MKNVILIGMPGAGKSTVGVILAKHLGYYYIDTDILIATTYGRTLPEILAEDGIDAFLEMEGAVGSGVRAYGAVIATGGSMVLRPEAMANLTDGGLVVWLHTPLEVLERRLETSRVSRGVAAPGNMTIADIYSQREPLYRRYADILVECEEGTDNVVAAVLDKVAGRLK